MVQESNTENKMIFFGPFASTITSAIMHLYQMLLHLKRSQNQCPSYDLENVLLIVLYDWRRMTLFIKGKIREFNYITKYGASLICGF